ncbi:MULTISPECIES: hypothetical protein [Saccharothrix]|uniref:hypothetical protein n=1 Tax=Saccharothrix TaxID=2071 RepID=UPI000939BE24|nr:hypothetical protein [Saccharothrix sp. CB00851]OKI17526.1 hypothetical protein A6A25_40740 [Saccharothrix sp. CB00851]
MTELLLSNGHDLGDLGRRAPECAIQDSYGEVGGIVNPGTSVISGCGPQDTPTGYRRPRLAARALPRPAES